MTDLGEIGKYQIIDTLGVGGFATVFRARDPLLDRNIALKVLHPTLLIDQQFVERFFREARTIANLRHPGIVTIHEVGEADGRAFLAMELASTSLASYLQTHGALAWPKAMALLRSICEALDYAHSRGVIHRDLKPANVLLTEDDRPLISDFGFARLVNQSSMSMSVSGGILGTPGYIAPEVWDQNSAEPSTDRYALACIAYELLTGTVLFQGTTPVQVMHAHDLGPQLPVTWPEGVPDGVGAVLARALSQDPAGRYPSSAAFFNALAVLDGAVQPLGTAGAPDPRQSQPDRPTPRPSPGWGPAGTWAGAGAVAALLLIVALVWLPRLIARPPEPSATATLPAPTTAPPTPGQAPTAVPQSAAPGVLRVSIDAAPSTLDPQEASSVDEIAFIMMAYEGLMSFDQNMQPIPAGASNVEVSADGLRYTFTLRPGSSYSDGTPLTARDYEYGWHRLADPRTAGAYQALPCEIIRGYSEYSAAACRGLSITETLALDREALRSQLGVRALDEHTLEIELAAPTPYFLSLTALWIGAPVRQQDVQHGDEWWDDPARYVGNGPFVLAEWDGETKAVWEPNRHYSGPRQPRQVERLEYLIFPDAEASLQAYRDGRVEILTVDTATRAEIDRDPALVTLNDELITTPGRCVHYFVLNVRYPPFDNKAVREAVVRAFDQKAWAHEIYGDLASPAYSFIPPDFPGYLPEMGAYLFSPQAARSRLAEAGYPGSEGLPAIALSYLDTQLNNQQFGWIAAQLREHLALEIELNAVDTAEYYALLSEDRLALIDHGWCADYADPHTWLAPWQTKGTLSADFSYSNPAFDELMSQTNAEQDPQRRRMLYAEAHRLLLSDAVIIPTHVTTEQVLVKPYVRGINVRTVTPLDYWWGSFNLQNISVEP